MKLHNTPNILIASNIDNFSRYEGDSFGISASASYSSANSPTDNQTTNSTSDTYTTGAYNPDSSGVGKSIGYGSDSDSQTSTTYSGINTSNITITGNGNTDTPVEAGTGIQTDDNGMKTITAANLADIFTSTTTDTIKENSGSLANTFDAEAVQNELDVQTRVTQTFDTNRQEVKAEINKKIDEANRVLEADPNNQEAQQTVEDMQHLGVLVDSISGALYSPSDNALGTVANTLSPAIVYEIGQYFKENEKLNKLDNGDRPEEGSAQHILAQTLVAAVTASLAGNDGLTAGLSAGGAEIIAPKLAEWLYDKDPQDLTSEEKSTISAIISLGSAALGATTGDTTDVISSSVAGTVAAEDNKLSKDEIALRNFRIAMCYGNEACILFWKAKFDIISSNNDMKAIGTGAVNIYNGLDDSLTKMWDNSPWYAKGTLITAGGIVALPVIVPATRYGITYAYMNPDKVLLGYGAIEALDGYYGGSSPGYNWGSFFSGAKNFIEGYQEP